MARILYLLAANCLATELMASSGILRAATARASAILRSPASFIRTSANREVPAVVTSLLSATVSFAI
jgi:hypothetical protein